MRGGSWINDARNARSAYRNDNAPGNANDNLGFRLCLSSRRRAAWTRHAPWTRPRLPPCAARITPAAPANRKAPGVPVAVAREARRRTLPGPPPFHAGAATQAHGLRCRSLRGAQSQRVRMNAHPCVLTVLADPPDRPHPVVPSGPRGGEVEHTLRPLSLLRRFRPRHTLLPQRSNGIFGPAIVR